MSLFRHFDCFETYVGESSILQHFINGNRLVYNCISDHTAELKLISVLLYNQMSLDVKQFLNAFGYT